jgi:hypothetical protein
MYKPEREMWDPHVCNNEDHSILGRDRGVILCLIGDFSERFSSELLNCISFNFGTGSKLQMLGS